MYMMYLQRLLENTDPTHADYPFLKQAEEAIHELALRINSVKESKQEDSLQETLKKLELLLITDVSDVTTELNTVQHQKHSTY